MQPGCLSFHQFPFAFFSRLGLPVIFARLTMMMDVMALKIPDTK